MPSISFHQIPDLVTPGFNPMDFVVSSDEAHLPGFRFHSTLQDESGGTIAEFYNLKQPQYGNLLFDSHRTIENYLSYDILNLINSTSGWQTGINVFKKYRLKVATDFPTPNPLTYGVHTDGVSGVSSYVYATNSAMNWQNFVNFKLGGRYAANSTRKWMTDQPLRIPIRIADHYELGAIVVNANTISYLKIETYDVSGTLLKTATKTYPGAALTTDAMMFPSILVGPADLNSMSLTTGTQPLIQANTHYYRVATFYVSTPDEQSLEWKEFEIDTSCTRDGLYKRLFWLNPLGRFDSFNFNFMTDDSIDVEKSKYNKLLGNLTSTTFTYNTYQQESSVFHSKVQQKYKLRSGYVNNEISQWLKELIASPLVYMLVPINSGNTFVAVTIDDSKYQAKRTEVEKLFNVEINVTLSSDTQRQRL